jgi:hypothetical protein
MDKMIKNEAMPSEDVTLLREKFINEYSKKKGWNPKELTTNQMLEITSQREFKTPGMILG